jgi:hypothetical protein
MAWPESQPGGVTGGFVCSPGADSIAGGGLRAFDSRTPGTDGHAVFGVVPNNDATVAVTTDAGNTMTVPVVSNMYFVDLGDGGYRSLTTKDVYGVSHTFRGIP